jgi:ribose transport system substrate-binding protein
LGERIPPDSSVKVVRQLLSAEVGARLAPSAASEWHGGKIGGYFLSETLHPSYFGHRACGTMPMYDFGTVTSTKKLKFLVSLTTNDNDYQIEQAADAEAAARRLGVQIQIVYADNDSITQSQQILNVIQSRSESLPDGIVFEPVGGTALPQVARAAVSAGVGWVVLNRSVEYIAEIREASRVPIFGVSSDHEEIGRIQGQQLAALLPKGGSVLYVQGPSESLAAKQRTSGMYETKPADVQVKVMRAQWTEASSYRAVSSWLRLSTSHQNRIDVVAAQDDGMALGARKAFQELPDSAARQRWLSLPFIGCDGLPKTGQAWVKRGLLTATIFAGPNTGQALEMLVKAFQSGIVPPERTLTAAESIPSLDVLSAMQAEKTRLLSV